MSDTKYDLGPPRVLSTEENDIVEDTMKEFAQLRQYRESAFENQWEEVASLILPSYRNTFTFTNYNTPGEKKTQLQVDASGMMALSRFAAICDSLLTPRNMFWHTLRADDDYVMKDRATQLWFESSTRRLFNQRYAPHGNFAAQNNSTYQSLGAFGTGSMFVDRFDGPHGERGLRYKSIPLGELYLRENHQGLVDGFIRAFKLTARQCMQKWGPTYFPEALRTALEANSETTFYFLHRVCPRKDYDPDRVDQKGMIYTSIYVSMEGRCVMRSEGEPMEGGYNTFPLSASRYDQAPNEVYGRGPAMMVLPALKTLNAQKRTFLKQGHRAADPVLLTGDDGLVDLSMRPGALNKGGVNADGKPMVHILPTGQIQTVIEMMQEEKSLINDAFLVTLFQILTESPQMTATEVIERTNEKGILLAPTVGRQQSEYLGPMIDRELDLMAQLGLLEPMPPRLQEASGQYGVIYTSPLSRAMRAQEAAGFMRTVEAVTTVAQVTADPSLFDVFDFDTAVPQIAEINGVKPSWMADDQKILAKREGRAKAQARQEQIQAAPAAAALLKAGVAQKEAGMTPGA